ncbi:MAG TPA: ABC transporter ATP-binding protein, partial [Terriglobia bacterium]|nr:ABC transporter ATP-binding protein [Terriglobia bacterium]
ELVFLDEPTSGLDPGGRRLVRDLIREQRARGATVFLNSHLLGEVEVTCDRVAFIKHGEVLATRRLEGSGESEMTVAMRARNVTPMVLEGLRRWASAIRAEDERLSFVVPSAEALPEILRYAVGQGLDVYEVTPQRLSLEDLFLQIVGEDGGL